MNKKEEPLVSIITPCFNMEKKIRYFLDSLNEQDYLNLEIILVNDGSTDGTEQIISEYIPQYKKKGYSVKYITQKNGGAASAIRTGLDYVTGEYLMWPDADDILLEHSIRSKVEFLETHKEYSFVRTNAFVIQESKPDERKQLLVKSKNLKRHKIYQECIRFKTFYCCGCYMVRWKSFLEVNPDKYIFQSRYGQNIQMLLPLAYRFECGYIDEAQYGYIIYEDSHSRLGGKKTYERRMEYSRKVEEIMLNTLQHMEGVPAHDIRIVKNDFSKRRMRIAYEQGCKEDVLNEYQNISGLRKWEPSLLIMKFGKNPVTDIFLKCDDLLDIALFQIKK